MYGDLFGGGGTLLNRLEIDECNLVRKAVCEAQESISLGSMLTLTWLS